MNREIKKNLAAINKNFGLIKKDYQVKKIGIFGSVAKGQQRSGSDLDILIEFSKPISFFQFIELEEFLSKILNKKVDLVSKKGLKQAIKKQVLKEVIYV